MTGETKGTGHWTLSDWSIVLSLDSGPTEYWRVVTVDGRPALVRNWRGMDLSAGDHRFEKE
jgi:hypothetical protein